MPQDITIADKKKFPYWQGRKPRTPLEGNIVKLEQDIKFLAATAKKPE